MRKLKVFNQVSLDGYFCDAQGDMSWAKHDDAEWQDFVKGNSGSGGELVFGRVTYEFMAGFWPTEFAAQQFPDTARGMNAARKVVFSRTLKDATWKGTRLMRDAVEGMRALKQEDGPELVVLGSGRLCAALTEARLVDEYQLVINPLVLGAGRTLFEGVSPLPLTLTKSRTFGNGAVVCWYAPRR
ncbi:MAG: dihydrofolate reductase family protein [Myxococcota bacterium]